jgi:hypothetical protein
VARGNGPGVTTTAKASKIEQRILKYLAARPGSSRVEATAWAVKPKRLRKAYNLALAD